MNGMPEETDYELALAQIFCEHIHPQHSVTSRGDFDDKIVEVDELRAYVKTVTNGT